MTEPAEKTLVANLVGPEHRGLAYGWFNCAIGIATLPASLVFGVLYQTFGPLVGLRQRRGLGPGGGDPAGAAAAVVDRRPSIPDVSLRSGSMRPFFAIPFSVGGNRGRSTVMRVPWPGRRFDGGGAAEAAEPARESLAGR